MRSGAEVVSELALAGEYRPDQIRSEQAVKGLRNGAGSYSISAMPNSPSGPWFGLVLAMTSEGHLTGSRGNEPLEIAVS